jgi:hypothetical protein
MTINRGPFSGKNVHLKVNAQRASKCHRGLHSKLGLGAEEKENKIAKQEKCKRLLPAMIESLMESLENVLRKYRNYLENYWDNETYEENEEYLDATAEAADWYCNYHSNLWRWGWKEETEDSWGM